MRLFCRVLLVFSFLCSMICGPAVSAVAADFPPLTPDDLKITSQDAGGADAIILYHGQISDDNKGHRIIYERRKILTERGRQYGDVRLFYDRSVMRIIDVKARTISPNGTATPVEGRIFDSTELRGHGFKYQAKSFAFPDVQVGSILELQYTEIWDVKDIWAPPWVLQEELPQKYLKFEYIPYHGSGDVLNSRGVNVAPLYTMVGLPKGVELKETTEGKWELEMRDVPAYIPEPDSPPEDAMKMRVQFYYGDRSINKPADFWRQEGKYWNKEVEKFIGHSDSVAQAARGLIAQDDGPEQKARKIYSYVQKLTNTSASSAAADQHMTVPNVSAEDVLKNQKGDRTDLTRLFVAMLRAVGVPASVMKVAARDEIFFSPAIPDARQLNSEIAIVETGPGKELYLDPGTPFCTFGMLEWKRTGVQGLRQKENGETELAGTPDPDYKQNMVQRIGQFELGPDGVLKGKLTMAWGGQEALLRRTEASQTDEAGRKKNLEAEVRRILPGASVIQLSSSSNWDAPDKFLQASFDVEVRGVVSSTGKRLVIPSDVFNELGQYPFTSAERSQPIYLPYPYWTLDKIQITLPAGAQVESLPQTQPVQTPFSTFSFQRISSGASISLRREFAIAGIAFQLTDYPVLKGFYEKVKTADEEQIVLHGVSTAGN